MNSTPLLGRTGPRERTKVRRNAPGHGLFEGSGLLVFGLDHDVDGVWLIRHFLDFDNKPDHARSLARAKGADKDQPIFSDDVAEVRPPTIVPT